MYEEVRFIDAERKDRCLDLLEKIFEDQLIQNRLFDLEHAGKFKEINELKDFVTAINPTTVYCGLIKRINAYPKQQEEKRKQKIKQMEREINEILS